MVNMSAPAPLDWADLYTEYRDKIYAYIYRRTSSQVLAEDLTSDTFIKAIDSTERGNGHETSFSGWLYRIAHNLVIDHYRARDRHQQVSIDEVWQLPDPKNSPVKAAEIAEDVETLDSVLRRLTPDQRTVLVLRFIHGYAFQDIADQMGKTEGAVKAIQHRALHTVKVLSNSNKSANRWGKSQAIIEQTLREYGPLSTAEIARCANISYPTVNSCLVRHPELFCQVGSDAMTRFFGLVGIHDKEAA
jgi:RNA polymerase sigma-70 factor (ECF subfamily)